MTAILAVLVTGHLALVTVLHAQKPTTWTIYVNTDAPGGGDILGTWSALSQLVACGDYKVCGWVDSAPNGFTEIYGNALVQWDVRTGAATVLGENTNSTSVDCAAPQANWPKDRHAYGGMTHDPNRKVLYIHNGVCLSVDPDDFWKYDLTTTPATWTAITTTNKPRALAGGVNWTTHADVFDSDNNILVTYGSTSSGITKTMIYCPTDLNPTPGTLTVNQTAAGCVADDWALVTTSGSSTVSTHDLTGVFIGGCRSIWFGGYSAGSGNEADPHGDHNEISQYDICSKVWTQINSGAAGSPPGVQSNFAVAPLAYAHGLIYHASPIDNHWYTQNPLSHQQAGFNAWTDHGLDTNIPDVVSAVNFGETMVFDPASHKLFLYFSDATTGLGWATVDLPQMSKESAIGGLGASTTTCLDKDGDGYGTGTGAGCTNGADADDNDAAVNTTATVLSTYGSLLGYFQIKYSELNLIGTSRLWHVASTGNDTTCAVGSFTTPPTTACATMSKFFSNYLAGDTILIRSGGDIVDNWDPQVDGTVAQPVLVAGYPGEKFVYKGNNGGSTFNLVDRSNFIIDCLGGDLDGNNLSQEVIGAGHTDNAYQAHIAIRNCHLHGAFKWQIVGTNGLRDFVVEDSVAFGNSGGGEEHVIYLGARNEAANHVRLNRNIFYHSGVSGNCFQFNGRVTDLVVNQNMFYQCRLSGISFEQGVWASKVTNNLAWMVDKQGLIIHNYDANADPSQNCFTNGTGGTICPYEQGGNLIQGNTFWAGVDFLTGAINDFPAIMVSNASEGNVGNVGRHIFRNNTSFARGQAATRAPVVFNSQTTSVFDNSIFQNNLSWTQDGAASNGKWMHYGGAGTSTTAKTCAEAAAIGTVSGCNVADPLWTSANTADWATPSLFNFAVTAGSPALSAGSALGALAVDIDGTARSQTTPTIGALEGEAAPPATSFLQRFRKP